MSWEEVRVEITRNKKLRLSDEERDLSRAPAFRRALAIGALGYFVGLLIAGGIIGGPLWFLFLAVGGLAVTIKIARAEFSKRERHAELVVRSIFQSLVDRVRTDGQLYDKHGVRVGRFDFVSNAVFVRLTHEPCGYWTFFKALGPEEVNGWINVLGPFGETESSGRY